MTKSETQREYELGPIRPPSESNSLLLRVTRNCPWNKCAFCPVYKQSKFQKRTEEDVIADIDLLAEAAVKVREYAALSGETDVISPRTCLEFVHHPESSETEKRMALWLLRGGRHVFLQDADSLTIPPKRIVRILNHLYDRFPHVDRVTTYARTRTLCARSEEQLNVLREAGLTRIHVGFESGALEVLELINKGCRPEHHIEGLKRTIGAGFEVCCYVMPGIGGKRYSDIHARETAAVLREIDPHHIRLRTLWIDPSSPLFEMVEKGEFEPLEEENLVREIQIMLKGLKGANGHIVSDHDLNLIGEIEGHLKNDADTLIALCQQFLDLPEETKDAFIAARRSGYFRSLKVFLDDPNAIGTFAPIAAELKAEGEGSLIKGIARQLGRRSL